MIRNLSLCLALATLVGIIGGCSEAPVVPVRPSNRAVLAEFITEYT
jgi:hypothetical protein